MRKIRLAGGLSNMPQKSSVFTLLVGMVFGMSLTFAFMWFQTTEYAYTNDIIYRTRHTSMYYSEDISVENDNQLQQKDKEIGKAEKQIRILCWVMTGPENHKKKAVHLKATWGKRFDTLLFMSSINDKDLPAVALPVQEGRQFLWGKTREAFNYVYNHYNGTYDWVMKSDDDTYVIVENLRDLLKNYDPNEPLYLGCRFKGFIKQGYMAGGAGYVLSREAVRRLVTDGIGNKKCRMKNDGGDEDAILGICLNKVGVKALDSRDHLGRDRFVQFSPFYVLNSTPDPHFWYWRVLYHHSKKGPDSCSDTAISFHYIGPSDMYVFEYFIYHLRVCEYRYAIDSIGVQNSTQNNIA